MGNAAEPSSSNSTDLHQGDLAKSLKSAFDTVDALGNVVTLIMFLHALVGLFAVIGNSGIVYAISKTPNLHKPSYILIAGMAFTDLFVGLLFYPFQIARLAFFRERSVVLLRKTENGFNTLSIVLYGMCFAMSLLISIDRYLALTLRLQYRLIVTKKRVVLAILSVTLIALAVASSLSIIQVFSLYRRSIVLVIGLLLVVFTFAFYVKSFSVLRRHAASVEVSPNKVQNSFNYRKYKRTLNTMVLILSWLLACYIPLLFGNYKATKINSTKFSVLFLHLCLILFGVNSCTNPVIYLIRFRDIRFAVNSVMLKSASRHQTRPQATKISSRQSDQQTMPENTLVRS